MWKTREGLKVQIIDSVNGFRRETFRLYFEDPQLPEAAQPCDSILHDSWPCTVEIYGGGIWNSFGQTIENELGLQLIVREVFEAKGQEGYGRFLQE